MLFNVRIRKILVLYWAKLTVGAGDTSLTIDLIPKQFTTDFLYNPGQKCAL